MRCKPRKREERQIERGKTSNSNNGYCVFLPKAFMALAPLLPLAAYLSFSELCCQYFRKSNECPFWFMHFNLSSSRPDNFFFLKLCQRERGKIK